jgi:hypothetical protein
MISFDEHGITITNDWTVQFNHDDMKLYLQRYFSADRSTHLDANKGFYRDATSKQPFHRNGVLSHKGAIMAFNDGEFEDVVSWLADQYGPEV